MQEFNTRLVNNYESKYNILEYVKKVNEVSNDPLDLSFMEELLGYVDRTDLCVPHTLLLTYGILNNEISLSADTKRLLVDNDFVENVDFKICNVAYLGNNGKTYHVKNYFLHPKAFKICIIRSKNTKKYTNYYLLLEESIKHYHDYQIMYSEHLLKQKDDNITKLSKDIEELKALNMKVLGNTEDIKSELHETKNMLTITNNILEVTNDILDGTNDKLDDTNDTLDDIVLDLSVVQTKLGISVEDRAVKPRTRSKVNQLVVMQSVSNELELYITCGQKYHVNKQVNAKTGYKVIKTINNVPNSIYLFDHIKKEFKGRITTKSRYVTLVTIRAEAFTDEVQTLFDGRTNVDLTKRP
jgi:phage anti-repressor protein